VTHPRCAQINHYIPSSVMVNTVNYKGDWFYGPSSDLYTRTHEILI